MPSQGEYDRLYLDIAWRIAKMSKAKRRKVGAIIVKDDMIVSYGYNGTPSGEDNCCEIKDKKGNYILNEKGDTISKDTVVHAEINSLLKAAKLGVDLRGATMYITATPCMNCAVFIYQSGAISQIVYDEEYRITAPIDWLREKGIRTRKGQEVGWQEMKRFKESMNYPMTINITIDWSLAKKAKKLFKNTKKNIKVVWKRSNFAKYLNWKTIKSS